ACALLFPLQTVDRAAAPRQLQIEAAQGLAVETDDRAELEVEIDILVVLSLAVARSAAAHRRLDEAAAVIDVAAYGHAQRAVGAAVGLERRLVAVGQAEHGEIRRHHV